MKLHFVPKRFNREVAIVQSASLGDAALLVPYIAALETNGFKVNVFCKLGLGALWKHFLNEAIVTEIDFEKHDQLSPWESYFEKYYEVAICTSIERRANYFATYLRTPRIFGLSENGRNHFHQKLLTERFYEADRDQHVIFRYMTLFSGYFKQKYFIEKIEFPAATKAGKLVVHPGGKWIPRRWHKESYVEVLKRAAKDFNQISVIVGPGEEDLRDYLLDNLSFDNIEVMLCSRLEDMISEISDAEYFLGNDSGPAHVANLFEKKMLILWGPGNFERIRPMGKNVNIIKKDIDCRPCKQYISQDRCEIGDNLCLRRISIDEVYNELIKMKEK